MHILSCLLTFTVLLLLQSDGASDEQKREQMEKLVREELERWDSESSIGGSGRGTSPSASSRRGGASSSVSQSPSARMRKQLVVDAAGWPHTQLSITRREFCEC